MALAPIEWKRRCAASSSSRTTCWMRRSRLSARGWLPWLRRLSNERSIAGEAAAVDVDEARHVAGQLPLGVDAMLRQAEADSRQPEFQDRLLLFRRDPVLHPGEVPALA